MRPRLLSGTFFLHVPPHANSNPSPKSKKSPNDRAERRFPPPVLAHLPPKLETKSRGPMTTAEEDVAGEDLEPLFDYKRVQPAMTFRFDDSDLEKAAIFKHCNKRAKVDAAEGNKADGKGAAGAEKASKAMDVEEEDWLAPPPPLPKPASRSMTQEDSALRELRLKKQELAKFAESAEDILRKLEETAKKEVEAKDKPEQIIVDDASEPQAEKAREKIVISVQDKGQQQFRIYKDDKFDKLFKAYAKKAKLNPSDLTFVFDGDKIDPESTPEDLDLEDNDMIEVSHKRQF